MLSSGGLGRQGGEVAAAADSMLHKLRRRDKRERSNIWQKRQILEKRERLSQGGRGKGCLLGRWQGSRKRRGLKRNVSGKGKRSSKKCSRKRMVSGKGKMSSRKCSWRRQREREWMGV